MAGETKGMAARAYQDTRILTSGRLPAIQLLIDESLQRLSKIQPSGSNRSEIVRCQNLIVQLEMAVNFRAGGDLSEFLFELLELSYLATGRATEKSLQVASYLLTHLRESLALSAKRNA